VALVETEKGVIEVEIFQDGTVESLEVGPGQKVPVGTILAKIRGDGEAAQPEPAPVSPAPKPVRVEPAPEAPVEQAARVKAAKLEERRMQISPLARKRAAELGVDLDALAASSGGGSITAADVEKAATGVRAPAPAAAPAPPKPIDLEAMRRAIAAAMARSKREIPHYYLSLTVDVSRALNWLAQENAKRPVTKRLLPAVLLLRAVALALRETPELNGFWKDGAFEPGKGVHVGVAISLRQGGLVNPAIHDADKKNLDELMVHLLDLVNRARSGHLRSSEISEGTITVTNLGEQGVESVFGVIYPPQVALVGFGKVMERPWAVNGLIGIRPAIAMTLAADHRASDGHRGGRFLSSIERLLQIPEKL
jgi:pyruvate dehydrogenase E2 component (dihydrolipoamide acetyltransferase)